MKFSATIFGFLLPYVILASPVPELVGDLPRPALEEGDASISIAIKPADIFKRSTQYCSIVNVSNYVNCRSGPSTSHKVVATAHEGDHYYFFCYEEGECIEGNWWVQSPMNI
jgi:hypothetical protein